MRGSVEIVSDPNNQGGRYCFAGTRIPVGSIVAYVRNAGKEAVVHEWGHGLTMAMVEAALAFDFPAQGEPRAEAERLDVRCVCGEWVSPDVYAIDTQPFPVECVCGRKWTARIAMEAVG